MCLFKYVKTWTCEGPCEFIMPSVCVCVSVSNGAGSQGQVVMERSWSYSWLDQMKGQTEVRHISPRFWKLSDVLTCVCVCKGQKGGKKHKRNGEQESYVHPCIAAADSAVLVKVTAHLPADIPPVCSYTLPSHRAPMATAPACWVCGPYSWSTRVCDWVSHGL